MADIRVDRLDSRAKMERLQTAKGSSEFFDLWRQAEQHSPARFSLGGNG